MDRIGTRKNGEKGMRCMPYSGLKEAADDDEVVKFKLVGSQVLVICCCIDRFPF